MATDESALGQEGSLPVGIPRNPAPLNQLSEPTKDGKPDENSQANCSMAGLAWSVRDVGTEADCDGDELKDEILGQGVTGFENILTDAKYAAVAKQHGVQLTPFYGSQQQLVAKAHAVLSGPAGDVLVNVGGGNNYLEKFADPAHFNGVGHVVVLAHTITGGLQAMNPWDGQWLNESDAAWEQMIVWGYIMVATPIAVPVPTPAQGGTDDNMPVLNITDPTVAPFFSLTSAGAWKCTQNGIEVFGEILLFYRNNLGLARLGLPLTNEIAPKAGSVARVRVFERGAVAFDPKRELDSPWGASGDCYYAHIEQGAVAAWLAAQSAAQLQQQLAQAQSAEQQAQAAMQKAAQELATAQGQVTSLEAQLTACAAVSAKGAAVVSAIKAALN